MMLFCYRFHYDYFMRKYPNAQLLFTDTDSLMYYVETEDIYQEMYDDRQYFDFASYPTTSKFYDPTNNKVVGLFKDETSGDPIISWIGLRPKMYSFQLYSDRGIQEKHRAKGIKKGNYEELRHERFKAQLDNPTENYVINPRIANKLHRIYGVEV